MYFAALLRNNPREPCAISGSGRVRRGWRGDDALLDRLGFDL